jgi:hypothetical protein
MNPQTLLNRPKPQIVPKITKISGLVDSSNEIKRSSTKLRKVFEKGTYQRKIQLTTLDRYKKRLDAIQKQNDKRFSQKSKVKIKLPDIKKYAGSFFTAGSTNDPLKSIAALAAFNSASKAGKGDWLGAVGPGLVAAGLLFGPGLIKGGVGKMFSGGKASSQSAPSIISGSPYSQTKAGKAYAGMQAERNLPKWAQKAVGGSSSRFAASNEKVFQGTANIGDRARVLGRRFGFGGIGGAAENIASKGGGVAAKSATTKGAGLAGRLIPGIGTLINLGLAGYRLGQGDYVGAALSGLSAIPGWGWAAVGVDVAREMGFFDGTILGRKDQLKEQTQKQKESTKKKPDKGGVLTFRKTLNSYEKSVNKFEEFSKGFKLMTVGADAFEGGPANPPNPTGDPYNGPVDGNSFNPLPGGTLSNSAVGIPKGEYGANRNYGGHSGQDIGGLPGNSPVVAWKTGKVTVEPGLEGPDNIVTIDHGNGVYSKYKHVVATVPNGTVVYGGQEIAKLLPGREEVKGRMYDTHLHFEVWRNGRHVNPNSDISAAQKIPAPLTPQRAMENYQKNSGQQSTAPSSTMSSLNSPQAQSLFIQDRPSTQQQITPTPAPRRQSIASYASYDSRSQAGQIIPLPIPIPQQQQQMMPSGSSGMMMSGPSEQDLLNSFYKRVLLNTV